MVHAQQAAVDTVLTNGKIITVDNGFTIAQAIAIRGDRFVAVGTTQDITRPVFISCHEGYVESWTI